MTIEVDNPSTMWANGQITYDTSQRYYKVFNHTFQHQFPDGSTTFHPPKAWQSCPIN